MRTYLVIMICLIILLVLADNSFAGGGSSVGNGGLGNQQGSSVYLLDLVNANEQMHPELGQGPASAAWVNAVSSSSFSDLGIPPELIALKLESLNQSAPGLGVALLATMRLFDWRLGPLSQLGENLDYDPANLFWVYSDPDPNLVRIADRLFGTIRVSQDIFKQMPLSNRIALLFHEAVYSLVRPRWTYDDGSFCMEQSLDLAMKWNGFFFSPASLNPKTVRQTLAEEGVQLQIPSGRILEALTLSSLDSNLAHFSPYENDCTEDYQYSVEIE